MFQLLYFSVLFLWKDVKILHSLRSRPYSCIAYICALQVTHGNFQYLNLSFCAGKKWRWKTSKFGAPYSTFFDKDGLEVSKIYRLLQLKLTVVCLTSCLVLHCKQSVADPNACSCLFYVSVLLLFNWKLSMHFPHWSWSASCDCSGFLMWWFNEVVSHLGDIALPISGSLDSLAEIWIMKCHEFGKCLYVGYGNMDGRPYVFKFPEIYLLCWAVTTPRALLAISLHSLSVT